MLYFWLLIVQLSVIKNCQWLDSRLSVTRFCAISPICHFGEIFKDFGNLFRAYFVFGAMFWNYFGKKMLFVKVWFLEMTKIENIIDPFGHTELNRCSIIIIPGKKSSVKRIPLHRRFKSSCMRTAWTGLEGLTLWVTGQWTSCLPPHFDLV